MRRNENEIADTGNGCDCAACARRNNFARRGLPRVVALDPALDVSQYAHTAWKIREGFATGTIHQIAQTLDGYLWLATEAGLLRFDGIRVVPWQPPQGEHLPSNDIRSLVAARDGTLWLGTAKGLLSWKDGKLTQVSRAQWTGDGQIAACQFLQRADPCSAVIHRAELVHVQPVSQLAGIDPVILVPLSAILPRIAHHQFRYVRLQQIVQPGRPGSFFKRDLQLSAQPVDKVQNGVRFGLDHAFHHDLSSSIPDRNRNTFLVHIHTDILLLSIEGVPFWRD